MIKALRGMKDIIDENDSKKIVYFYDIASKMAQNFGFSYIETPKLELTTLFKRSVGESSDIVGKEMYQFIDKANNDVCLRPENIAGVVRAFIEKKLDRIQSVKRYYYFGSMFRYERPQKGRLREFHQFGCESFKEPSVYEDANMIIFVAKLFDELKIKYEIELNSLGCNKCLPDFKEKLITFLNKNEDSICQDCKRRKDTNPIRVLDCKNLNCQEIYKKAPLITDHLCNECENDFLKLQDILKYNGIDFKINKNLVRGLDYYTKTAFEFISTDIGAQSAIAGGGRYDRLVEFLGGRKTPAVGFAIGVERIFELISMPSLEREGAYVGILDKKADNKAFSIATILRQKIKTFFNYDIKSLKSHLKSADKLNAKTILIIGEDELKNNTIWLKNLQTKEEKIIAFDEVKSSVWS